MTNKKCSIEDCDRLVRAKGLCAAHYERLRKYGDPTYVHVRGPRSENVKAKISATMKGRKIWEEASKPHPSSGRTPSEETKLKISDALKGNTNYVGKQNALGKNWTLSQETRERQKTARARRSLADNPSYGAVHIWMSRNFQKTEICEACGEARTTYWANISGDYRRERDDFWELCVPCHKIFDYILAIDRFDPERLAIMYAKRDTEDDSEA